jgi:hypothetical protein
VAAGTVKGDAFVDPLGDRQPLDRVKFGAGQPLARGEISPKEQIVTRYRHPVDALEHCINADPSAVFGIFQARCDRATAPQLWERGSLVFAGAVDIQNRVAGGTTPLACQCGAELARRAELDVIGNQLLVFRVRATFDDDIARLQLEAGDVHEAVLDAASEQGSGPDGGKGEHPAKIPSRRYAGSTAS